MTFRGLEQWDLNPPKNAFPASGMKRRLLWEHCTGNSGEKGNMQGSGTGDGTVGRSTDVQQKFPLGPWCSVVFLSAILAGMSPSLFVQKFNLLLKLI